MATNENGALVRVTVSVRPEQKAWLDANVPPFNVSALIRELLDKHIAEKDAPRPPADHQEPQAVTA